MTRERKYNIYLDGGKDGLYYLSDCGMWSKEARDAAALIKTDMLYWLERKRHRFGNKVNCIPAPYGGRRKR